MSSSIRTVGPSSLLPRRSFLGSSGLLLSGTAVALLAGKDALAKTAGAGAGDVRILNTAPGSAGSRAAASVT